MLSPTFRWLDPDPEQLQRLAALSPYTPSADAWQKVLEQQPTDVLQSLLTSVVQQLATPGSHPQQEIAMAWRVQAQAQGISLPLVSWWGWPEFVLQPIANGFPHPGIWLLGILTAEGIWAGVIVGMTETGVDLLTTFNFLWQDEPELASYQSLSDLSHWCSIAHQRFRRMARGLFIYRNEFELWRDQNWSQELLREFIQRQTALTVGL